MTNKTNKQNYDYINIFTALFDAKKALIFRPILNDITGSIIRSILLNQMVFRWNNNGKKEFYKFKEPCNNPKYRPGDSWTEELNISAKVFDTALKGMGFKLGKTQNKLKKEEALIIYRKDSNMLTWYSVNEYRISYLFLTKNNIKKYKIINRNKKGKIIKKTKKRDLLGNLPNGKIEANIPNGKIEANIPNGKIPIAQRLHKEYTDISDYSLGATPLTADSNSSLLASTNNKKSKKKKPKVPSDSSRPSVQESRDITNSDILLSAAIAPTPPQTPPQKKPSKNQKTTEQLINDQIEKDVNEINKIFYDSDPTMDNLLFRNKNQRKAVKELLAKFGKEQVKIITHKAIEVRGQAYAPVISCPLSLKAKLIKLKLFFEREKNKKREEKNKGGKKIMIGTDFSKIN